jgi:urease accessory protein
MSEPAGAPDVSGQPGVPGPVESLLALLQFSDGLFPAGGFAHSFGLETYAQAGVVRDGAGLGAFLVGLLEGSAGPADAVAVVHASRLAGGDDLSGVCGLDALLDAMKLVPEQRAASRQMGRQTLRVGVALGHDPLVAGLTRAVEDGVTPGHHAVAFGVVTGRAGVDAGAAAAAFLHATAALLINAGLRLLPVGQLEGQRLLASVRPRIARLARQALDADGPWSFTPGLEVAGILHATLPVRLFRS